MHLSFIDFILQNSKYYFFKKLLFFRVIGIVLFISLTHQSYVSGQCIAVGNPNSGQQGQDLCAPVTKRILYSFDFISPVKPPPTTNIQIRWRWNDGQLPVYTFKLATITGTEIFPGDTLWTASGFADRTFPNDPTVFEYEVEIYLSYNGF